MTLLDIPAYYGNYETKNIIFVPPAVSYCKNVIGVSTINGRMTIVYHNIKNSNLFSVIYRISLSGGGKKFDRNRSMAVVLS